MCRVTLRRSAKFQFKPASSNHSNRIKMSYKLWLTFLVILSCCAVSVRPWPAGYYEKERHPTCHVPSCRLDFNNPGLCNCDCLCDNRCQGPARTKQEVSSCLRDCHEGCKTREKMGAKGHETGLERWHTKLLKHIEEFPPPKPNLKRDGRSSDNVETASGPPRVCDCDCLCYSACGPTYEKEENRPECTMTCTAACINNRTLFITTPAKKAVQVTAVAKLRVTKKPDLRAPTKLSAGGCNCECKCAEFTCSLGQVKKGEVSVCMKACKAGCGHG